MKYETLYEEFTRLFPNDLNRLQKIAENVSAEPSDGMHIMFGMVVIPFIMKLLEHDDKAKLTIAFEFFEKMATDNNPMVSEVLEFTILEDIISRGADVLNKCKPYMKQHTLESCLAVEQYLM